MRWRLRRSREVMMLSLFLLRIYLKIFENVVFKDFYEWERENWSRYGRGERVVWCR